MSITRFRALRKRRPAHTVTIGGEAFAFSLSMRAERAIRAGGGRDPVPALFALTRRLMRVVTSLGMAPVLSAFLKGVFLDLDALGLMADENAEEKEDGEEQAQTEGQKKMMLRVLRVLQEQGVSDDTPVADLIDVALILFREFSGEILSAVSEEFDAEFLAACFDVFHWGLSSEMPDLTRENVEEAVGIAGVPGLLLQVVPILLGRARELPPVDKETTTDDGREVPEDEALGNSERPISEAA